MDNNKARPTIYRGTTMRSRLEAGYAAWLDRQGITWAYEPLCFASQRGQYLPDFGLQGIRVTADRQRHPVFVEVKPVGISAEPIDLILSRMEIVLASEPAAVLMLATPDDVGYWCFPLKLGADTWGWGYWARCFGCDARTVQASASATLPVEPRPCVVCQADTIIVTPWTDRYWAAS